MIKKSVWKVDEKNNFAMLRCEFRNDGTGASRGDFHCTAKQLAMFVAEAVNAVAKQLSLEPSEIAALAIMADKSYRRVVDESENREES